MSHRFRFLGTYNSSQNTWRLDDGECQHFQKVLRLESGVEIEVFNGHGLWAMGRSEVIERQQILVHPQEQVQEQPNQHKVAIGLGAIKGSDFEDTLPGLVELGVDQIFVFLQDGVEKKRIHDKAQQRWARIVVAATKQAKRNWLPTITCATRLDKLEQDFSSYSTKILLSPDAKRMNTMNLEGSALAVLGSEKGLDQWEEKLLMEWGFEKRSIARHVLRARTAALAAAAIINP